MLLILLFASSANAKTTNQIDHASLPNPGDWLNPDGSKKPKPNGPFQVLSKEQRIALSRIKSRGFIIGQEDLKDGRKKLTWTDGKNTIVTTQKVDRVNGGKARDPRRAEIAAVKAERDTLKTENDKLKKEKTK